MRGLHLIISDQRLNYIGFCTFEEGVFFEFATLGPSTGPSTGPSVGPSVGPSTGPSVGSSTRTGHEIDENCEFLPVAFPCVRSYSLENPQSKACGKNPKYVLLPTLIKIH